MPDLPGYSTAAIAVIATVVPLLVITLAVAVIALASLCVRSSESRRHCRQMLRALTEFAAVLRGRPLGPS